jgi:GNAT acetyltransferase-like protein
MTLQILNPNELTPALFREIAAFLDSQETSHPFQFPQWSGATSRFAVMREDGKIRWFARFGTHFALGRRFPGFRALTMNRGPVCDDARILPTGLEALVECARQEGFIFVEAAPESLQTQDSRESCRWSDGWIPHGGGRSSLRLGLTKSDEELLAGLRKNTRYDVRRAQRADLLVSPAIQDPELEEFLQLYKRTADRKGFTADPPEHIRNIARWLLTEPDRGATLLARDQASLAGGAVIVRAAQRCWYVWGASEKRNDFSAGHALQWHALQWARAHGCTEYDFGGYTPGATSGPAWFKEGFGGEIVHFVPAHRRVIRHGRYRLFAVLSKLR